MISNLTFAEMKPEHIEGAMRLSTDAGWPHRHEDWALVANISRGFVALEDGEVVSTALVTPFGPVAMANMIIVDARLRGRGLGRDIMHRAMAALAPAQWRLIATSEGLPLYEKLGFQPVGEIRQHQGLLTAQSTEGPADWAEDSDLPGILALDAATIGLDRSALYQGVKDRARFAVIRDGAKITGFAAVRPFGRGEVVGPVIAADLAAAKSLLALIMSSRQGQFLRVDTDAQTGLSDWLSTCGLAHVGGGTRMEKGTVPGLSGMPAGVFALFSQAIG